MPFAFGAASAVAPKPRCTISSVAASTPTSSGSRRCTLSRRFASGQVDDAWIRELHEHARRMHRNGLITEDELMAAMRKDLRLRVHSSGAAAADAAP